MVPDDGAQFVDVVGKDPVFAGKFHKIPDIIMGGLENFAAFEGASEFDGLAGAHHFDGEDVFQVVQDLVELPAADAAHADMVFLAQGGGDAVGAGGEAECFILGDQGGGGVLGDHETAVQPYIAHQQDGKSPFAFQQQVAAAV